MTRFADVLARGRPAAGQVRTRRACWLRRLGAATLVGVAALLSWPVPYLIPGTGIDPSWRAALHLAARRGMDFGQDLIYGYGPLGFVTVPQLYFESTTILSLIFVGLLHLALCSTIFYALRRRMTLWVAVPVTIVAARVLLWLEPAESLALLVFLWAVILMTDELPKRQESLALYAGAALSGIALLLKLNTGLAVLAVTMLTVVALRSHPAAWAKFGAVAAVTFLLGWTVTGQPFGNLDEYSRTSFEILSGYSRNMGIEQEGRRWELAGSVGVVAIVTLFGISAARGAGRRKQLMLVLTGALFGFAVAKHAFVRHDDGHSVPFFAMALLTPLAFGVLPKSPRRVIPSMALSLVGMVALTAAFLKAAEPSPRTGPVDTVRQALFQAKTMSTSNNRLTAIEGSRQEIRRVLLLDQRSLDLVGERTVHIDPWEAVVAWAYPELNWDPVPAFQSFTASTDSLDDLNTRVLRSKQAPEMILRQSPTPRTIDYRYFFFESPGANLAVFCNYIEVHSTKDWQVLQKTEDRCGKPRLLGTSTGQAGDELSVPPGALPNEMIIVKLWPQQESLLHKVRTVLYRSTATYFDPGRNPIFRLVTGNAQNGLVLKTPPELGYAPSFAPQEVGTLSILSGQLVYGEPTREQIKAPQLTPKPFGRLRFEFYAVPLNPGPGRPADLQEPAPTGP